MPTASQEERSVSPKATAGNKVMNLYRAIRSCRRHEGSVLTYIQLLRPRTSARLILWGRTWAVAHRAPVNCQLNWRVPSHVENNSTCTTKWETESLGCLINDGQRLIRYISVVECRWFIAWCGSACRVGLQLDFCEWSFPVFHDN